MTNLRLVPMLERLQIYFLRDYSDKFDTLTNEIKNLPNKMPQHDFSYDPIRKSLIHTIRNNGVTRNKIYKSNRLLD